MLNVFFGDNRTWAQKRVWWIHSLLERFNGLVALAYTMLHYVRVLRCSAKRCQ